MTKMPKHTSLSLAGNVPVYEYSNKLRAKMYDKYDPFTTNSQSGKGFWGDVLGGAASGLAGIGGTLLGGPVLGGAAAGGAGYGVKKWAEQQGLGYQYKSKGGARGMWGTSNNALGPVSQNMVASL